MKPKIVPNVLQIQPVDEVPEITTTKQAPGLYWKPVAWTAGVLMVLTVTWFGAAAFVTQAMARTISSQTQAVGQDVKSIHQGLVGVREVIGEKHEIDALYFKILQLKPSIEYVFAHRLATIIHQEAQDQKMDPNFVIALIRTESNFKSNALSPTGAMGLTQIMPFWKQILQIQGDLNDPEVSIRYGIQIFKSYEKMYGGHTLMAMAAYNQGPKIVNATLRQGGDPRENNDYTAKFQTFYTKLKWIDRARTGL